MENIENVDDGMTQITTPVEFKRIGCGLLVAKTMDREIKCREEMFGNKRYCAHCQNLINNSHSP